jgi:sulfur carrier protein ThiS
MEVKIKLYGTLRLGIENYKPSQGILVEIPDGATVKELLAHLEIPEARGAVVIADGRVLKADDEIQDGASVNVFQSVQGG